MTDPAAVAAGVARVEADLGPIDILVNNAGMQFRAPLEDFPHDKWAQLLATNVSSAFYVGQAVAKHMIARGRGKIVNVASVQSELARPGIAPYTATKGAIRNLTRGMATDWARLGLQVNAIAPGYFRTPLNHALIEDPAFCAWLEARTPAGRWGEVARADRRRGLPRLRRLVLRQRPRALRRRRHHREPLTGSASASALSAHPLSASSSSRSASGALTKRVIVTRPPFLA